MTSIAPYHGAAFAGHTPKRELSSSDVPRAGRKVLSASSSGARTGKNDNLKSDEPLSVNFTNIKAPVNIKPIGLSKVSPIEIEIQEQLTQFQGAVSDTISQTTTIAPETGEQTPDGFQRAEPAPSAALTQAQTLAGVISRAEQSTESFENDQQLSDAEREVVTELKRRDQEVRAHEAAHKRAGGNLASAPSYQFTRGPDNIQYAVAGEVSIDTKPVDGNPQKTIEKMETVRKAALAPSNPSSQDRRVAAQAEAVIRQARSDLNEQRDLERAEEAEAAAKAEENESLSRNNNAVNNATDNLGNVSGNVSGNNQNIDGAANTFSVQNQRSNDELTSLFGNADQGLSLARQQSEAYGNFGLNNRAQNPDSNNLIADDDRRARPQSISLTI